MNADNGNDNADEEFLTVFPDVENMTRDLIASELMERFDYEADEIPKKANQARRMLRLERQTLEQAEALARKSRRTKKDEGPKLTPRARSIKRMLKHTPEQVGASVAERFVQEIGIPGDKWLPSMGIKPATYAQSVSASQALIGYLYESGRLSPEFAKELEDMSQVLQS